MKSWKIHVIGTEVVERHFKTHVGHKGIKATRTQYNAWLAIVGRAQWRTPEDVKASYPKASILKGSRVVFNIKGNDYRLIASVRYQVGVLAIRFFGTDAEYEKIDAESVWWMRPSSWLIAMPSYCALGRSSTSYGTRTIQPTSLG
jgi:mRNA interferase HigB